MSAVRLYGEGLGECLATRRDILVVGAALDLAEIETLLQHATADVVRLDFPERRARRRATVGEPLLRNARGSRSPEQNGTGDHCLGEVRLRTSPRDALGALRGDLRGPPRIAGTLLRELRRRPEGSYVIGEDTGG